MTEPRIVVERLAVPDRRGGEGWSGLLAYSAVADEHDRELTGAAEPSISPDERLAEWRDPIADGVRWLARRGGEPVGIASLGWQRAAPETVWWTVAVRPGYPYPSGVDASDVDAGRVDAAGIDAVRRALVDAVEAQAAGDGATQVLASSVSPATAVETGGSSMIEAATGAGGLPVDDPMVDLLVARGYRLEQVHRLSRLALPVDADHLDALAAQAEERADDYEALQWDGPTPAEHLAGIGELLSRIEADLPTGDLDRAVASWDAARVDERDRRLVEAGTEFGTAAVRRRSDGVLAGYTRLVASPGAGEIRQLGTIVRGEDRGHRLGLLLKAVNLRAFVASHPGHSAVTTSNAWENEHMLAVNEAIGMRAYAFEGAWRRDLRASGDRA